MLRTKDFLLIALFFLVFWGCSAPKLEVAKLSLPQDANYYITQQNKLDLPANIQSVLQNKYLEIWYNPWKNPVANPDLDEVFWVAPSLLKALGYGPNLKRYTIEEMQKLYNSMDIEHYPSAAIKAIVTKDTMVRAVPTMLPRFKSKDNYPFDRWQNSLIFRGTPVLITHYNLTRDWAHVQSSFVYGWIRVEDLAKITKEQEKFLIEAKKYIVANADKTPIYNDRKDYVGMARIGEIFVVKEETKNAFKILLPERRSDGLMDFVVAEVLKSDFAIFPKRLDVLNMASVVDSMMGQFYGWGGGYDSRDCSAFIRDSFANFGIYLPRNSAAQAKYPKNMVDLKQFNASEKEEYILKNATPFATILWLKGHIMLYLGEYDGRAVVAHSAWSVMTRKLFTKYENLLGGVVITTLTPSNEKNGTWVKSKTLLDKVLGMSDLYTYILGLSEDKRGE